MSLPDDRLPGDPDLVAALVAGDREALGTLYARHGGTLLAVAVRVLGDVAEAEEVVHEVFVEAWRLAEQYDPRRGSVRAWLVTRARSRALDRAKTPARSRRSDLDAVAEPAEPAPATFDGGRVHRALAALTAPQREVLELGYFEGLSSTEISARLGVPVGTVKSRVAAGLQRLRELLASTEAEA